MTKQELRERLDWEFEVLHSVLKDVNNILLIQSKDEKRWSETDGVIYEKLCCLQQRTCKTMSEIVDQKLELIFKQ